MGQRNMTYVVIKDGEKVVFKPLYCQWNYEIVQPHKVIRFIKQLNIWNKNKTSIYPNELAESYKYLASISPQAFIGFHDEMENYDDKYGLYCEDNNNGWTIVYVWRDTTGFHYSVGFKAGDELRTKKKEYMDMKTYINIALSGGDTSYATYLKRNFTKTEIAVFNEIAESFDKAKIREAELLMTGIVKKKVKK